VSISQVEAELSLVAARFPLSVSVTPNDDLEVIVTLLYHRCQSKARLALKFPKELLLNWPSNINRLGVRINASYGSVPCVVSFENFLRLTISRLEQLTRVVKDRLSQITVAQCYGSLLDVCVLAAAF
jgi:hypothetical protein